MDRTDFAEMAFSPPDGQRHLPVEVLDRADVLDRSRGPVMRRPMFHQLVVCTSGEGTHDVDFERVAVRTGTVLRLRPGQVQRFVREPHFDARMIVWPDDATIDRDGRHWFPGSSMGTRWDLSAAELERFERWIDELAEARQSYDGTAEGEQLMRVLLEALLLRLVQLPGGGTDPGELARAPTAYTAFRSLLEQRVTTRPTVRTLAHELGYSPRTIDRASRAATGRSAKEILDERIVLEVRRLLLRTERPVSQIGRDLGFNDPSNFSNFVRRHLGDSPGEVRSEGRRRDT